MRSFREISLECGTDKSSLHGYDVWYERHLSGRRNDPLSLLEIGVQTGASLRLWEQYFPQARIYGIDHISSCKACGSDRSKVFIGFQEDEEFLSRVAFETGDLDVVIDDGGHHMWQQQASFRVLFPKVRPGGLYVIEDLETSYQLPFEGGPPGLPGTTVSLIKSLFDDLNLRYHRRPRQASAAIAEIHLYKNIAFLVRA